MKIANLKNKKRGFSLVEFSIVLIVIAVLFVAITQGQFLLNNSKVTIAANITKSAPMIKMENFIIWYETTSKNSFNQDDIETISTWYNLAPEAKSNNASSGNAPTFKRDGINSLPALNFNGSSNYLAFDGANLANKSYTIFTVEKRLSSKNENYFISGISAADNDSLLLGYGSNTAMTFGQVNNNYNVTIESYENPIPRIHTFRFSPSFEKNYAINGASQILVPSGTPNPSQGLISFNNAQIGRFQNNKYYEGDIGEIIIFNRYLNNDEKSEIENYLAEKWRIIAN